MAPRSGELPGPWPNLLRRSDVAHPTCSIRGCNHLRYRVQTGWCQMHYQRWYRNGDPHVMKKPHGSLMDRLWAKVLRGPDCWEWQAAVSSPQWPYGVIQRGTRGEGHVLAHRAVWENLHGPIPELMEVCHHCDNPRCVRPDHLFLGTSSDNKRDMHAKGRAPRHMRPGYKRHLAVINTRNDK